MRKNIYRKLYMLVPLCLMIFILSTTAQAAGKKKVLVAYFSVTNNTKAAAQDIAKASGGKLYRIKPAQAYTKKDINYNNDNCRANREQRDASARPAVKGKVKNIRKYGVIFIGYPIWHGKEPKVIKTFLESYNLKGEKIVPFCTSGGSGISGSMKGIRESAKGAKVKKGKDLSDASYGSIKKWVRKKLK